VTTHYPDAMEVVFYSYGSSAICGGPSSSHPDTSVIVVQVPYERGVFNLADASFNRLSP
jgi:hypothetical protein